VVNYINDMNELKKIYLTKSDHEKLKGLINKIPFNSFLTAQVKDLREELNRAVVVESADIPEDIVTMNSRIDIENLDSDKITTLQLVYPDDANIDEQKISIFSPIGTAIIGYRVGDIIDWPVPSGMKKFKIKTIHYQPEASGSYDL
jgi:regulator of nucleoside diphosphate kinase